MNNEKRSSLVKINILISFFLKGWSGLVTLLLVPVTLLCLGNYTNGIWLTISSLLLWVDSFDIGLGNGLRNRLAEHLAKNEIKEARATISSAFMIMYMIIIPIVVVLICILNFVDCYSLFNVDSSIVSDLQQVLVISLVIVSVTFVFKLIGNVYLGMQLTAANNFLIVLGQTFVLIGMYILRYYGVSSLLATALVYTLSPLAVYLIAHPITFVWLYPQLRPSFALFSFNRAVSLLNIGLKFFVIQIASIILFATSNAIISHYISPDQVTPYQIAYRYFSVILMVFAVIASPLWSATTDAYHRDDIDWIKESMKKIRLVVFALTVVMVLMCLCSKFVYNIWIGEGVDIPFSLTIAMGCYIFILMVSMSYSYYLNGFGFLYMQIIMTVCAALIFLPLSYILCTKEGITGMCISLCLVNIPGAIVNYIQYYLIVNKKTKGIWKK